MLINNDDNKKIVGTGEADSIYNTGSNVTIAAGKGNDTITGSEHGERFQFAYTHGNNVITNFGTNDTLQATNGTPATQKSGNDMVVSIAGETSSVCRVTLQGAGDFDFIKTGNVLTVKSRETLEHDEDNAKFVGTDGDDWMINTGENVTIQGKSGNDTIEASDGSELFRFGAADGDDVILGFGKTDTLKITSGSISKSYASDDDYIIEVKNGTTYSGSVTLKNVSAIKVSGKNVTATSFNAQLPADDYWFEASSEIDELDDLISETNVDNALGMIDRDDPISLASARIDLISTTSARQRKH